MCDGWVIEGVSCQASRCLSYQIMLSFSYVQGADLEEAKGYIQQRMKMAGTLSVRRGGKP